MHNVTLPVHARAPLEYRYALDAAGILVGAGRDVVLARGNLPQLEGEVRQRFGLSTGERGQSGIWLEPRTGTWRAELDTFTEGLPEGAPLVVILSLPLSCLVPERRTWAGRGRPVGMSPIVMWQWYQALKRAGFACTAVHGVHTVTAIGMNLAGRMLERCNRQDLADRLGAAGRLHYHTSGLLAPLSTVGVVVAARESTGARP